MRLSDIERSFDPRKLENRSINPIHAGRLVPGRAGRIGLSSYWNKSEKTGRPVKERPVFDARVWAVRLRC